MFANASGGASILAARRGMVLALAAVLLASCGTGPAPDTYDLSALTPQVTAPARKRQVLVTEPTAVKALDSDQIVVRLGGSEIQYLSKAQWADRLPRLVQARLVQALENTGKLAGVGKPGQGLAIDDQIVSDIRAFEIVTGGSSVARVEISVKLLNDRNGTIRAQKSFSAEAPAGSGNPSFVKALDRAFASVTDDIVAWVLTSL
ncbi:ABC-type transport auxiliary lipoprotein family protein [Gellertiella hungarica]|nr:ABC-type transport auxiliary lipoprotein family protein [Gellertiella hungarica]